LVKIVTSGRVKKQMPNQATRSARGGCGGNRRGTVSGLTGGSFRLDIRWGSPKERVSTCALGDPGGARRG